MGVSDFEAKNKMVFVNAVKSFGKDHGFDIRTSKRKDGSISVTLTPKKKRGKK
jgi:hypothetical protein